MKTLGLISLQVIIILLGSSFVVGYKYSISQNSKRGAPSPGTLAQTYLTKPKLLDEETQKMFREGTRGPCGPSMAFEQSLTNPNLGVCTCVASNGCSSNNPKYNRTGPLLRHPETNQCYRLNSQGPCMANSVLMKGPEGTGICRYPSWDCGSVPGIDESQIRQTLSNLGLSHEFDFIKKDSKMYVYNETCYKTWTQGHCKLAGVNAKGGRKSPSRGDGTYAVFVGTLAEPYCFSRLKYALKAVTCRGQGKVGVQHVPSRECPQHFKRVGLDCVPELG